MVILVVFNSFNVVQNLKKPDTVARQMPPFNTTKHEISLYSRDQEVLQYPKFLGCLCALLRPSTNFCRSSSVEFRSVTEPLMIQPRNFTGTECIEGM